MGLAERIQTLRKQSGLSQEELGARLGVSRQAVSKWETGQTLPDTGNLLALAELFGVSLDQLAGEKQAAVEGGQANENPGRKGSGKRKAWLAGLLLLLLALLVWKGLPLLWNMAAPNQPAQPQLEVVDEAVWSFEQPTAKGDWGLFWQAQAGAEYLALGVQTGSFPFATSLLAAKDLTAVGDDSRVTQHTVTCDPLSLVYTVVQEAGQPPRSVLWSMATLSADVKTSRGLGVGDDQAALLAAYDDGSLYYHLKEHGDDLLCQHDFYYIYALAGEGWANQLYFYMANGKIAGVQVKNLEDGAGSDPVDQLSCFPLANGEPDFSQRNQAELESVDATRRVYIALHALTTDENLSPEEQYQYRLDIFSNLQFLDWAAYGSLGEAGRETETQLDLTNWLRNQQSLSNQELLGLQLAGLSQPDGFLAEEYSAILCQAFFRYPVEFAQQLAHPDNPPDNAAQIAAFTAYGADIYPEQRDQAAAELRHWGLTGLAGDWAQVLLQALADPYGENGPPQPPASVL